jgi:hypothetical protein
MQTINGINQQLQTNQARIDAENGAAEIERGRSEEYRGAGDNPNADAHARAAMDHEQRALRFQDENAALIKQQEQLQAQITALDQQKAGIETDKANELAGVDAQIDKLRGGA